MPPKRTQLILIDGSSYVFRAYFALPPLTTPGGVPVHAVYGVATMLLKLIADTRPDYIAFVLDAPGKTFRDDLFEQYKATRDAPPPDLGTQIELIREVVAGLQMSLICVPGVEADDVIATLAKQLPDDFDCVVVTGDKDLMQLVSPRIRLWDTMRNRWTDEAGVLEKLGVRPDQVVDVMALMGDAIDNVPGVRGIGAKTAVSLIQEFGSLESVLAEPERVATSKMRGAKKVAELLRTGSDMARLSRSLVELRSDLTLDVGIPALRYEGPNNSVLQELFARLGFQSLVRQLASSAPPPTSTITLETLTPTDDLEARLVGHESIALVVIVPPGPPATSVAREILLAAGDDAVTQIPIGESPIAQVLQEASCRWVAHDWKRDSLALHAAGIDLCQPVFDTMIASYLLEAAPQHDLGTLTATVLGTRVDGFRDSLAGAAEGVAVLPRIATLFGPQIEDRRLTHLYHDVEIPLTRILGEMERRGILLDVAHLAAMSKEISARLDALTTDIYELAGVEFNLGSSQQLREILFERLSLPTKGVKRGKTGLSTDVDVLTRLATLHALPAKMLEVRMLSKLKSTYVDALPAAVNAITGRLHTTFNQTVAATGRLSSTDPNLQNIPIRGEEGRRIRKAFIAPPDSLLLAADYSQIELRVLAHLSGDAALLDAFRTNQDIHTRTAAEVFGVFPGTVSAEMRRAAKVINFGIIYGMGPQRLAGELSITIPEAQRYIESYFVQYSGVRSYMQSVLTDARTTGFVTTLLGRRRSVPDLRSTDRNLAQAAERVATNTPIQGTAADLIKMAMVAVHRRIERDGLQASILLQVHDELLFEVRESDQERATLAIREEMEGVLELKVPLKVEVGVGKNWAEAH